MFTAPLGILAQYQREGLDDQGHPHTHQWNMPVFAFTNDGKPMVIDDEAAGHHQRLVQADTYDGYVGMTCDPAVFDELSGRPVSPNGHADGTGTADTARKTSQQADRESPISRMTEWEIAAVEFAALRALEIAGKRLLTGGPRGWRGALPHVPAWELHTHIPAKNLDKVLTGAYDLIPICLPGQNDVYSVIDRYVRERLESQRLHDPRLLLRMLAEADCLPR